MPDSEGNVSAQKWLALFTHLITDFQSQTVFSDRRLVCYCLRRLVCYCHEFNHCKNTLHLFCQLVLLYILTLIFCKNLNSIRAKSFRTSRDLLMFSVSAASLWISSFLSLHNLSTWPSFSRDSSSWQLTEDNVWSWQRTRSWMNANNFQLLIDIGRNRKVFWVSSLGNPGVITRLIAVSLGSIYAGKRLRSPNAFRAFTDVAALKYWITRV